MAHDNEEDTSVATSIFKEREANLKKWGGVARAALCLIMVIRYFLSTFSRANWAVSSLGIICIIVLSFACLVIPISMVRQWKS
mmetsp:Transcript_14144/g.22051  ORF Transcript_14144/g.22051 Transcript_14144/m.22051 type:complete len:83 (+) Transcript_14144:462-710(+)